MQNYESREVKQKLSHSREQRPEALLPLHCLPSTHCSITSISNCVTCVSPFGLRTSRCKARTRGKDSAMNKAIKQYQYLKWLAKLKPLFQGFGLFWKSNAFVPCCFCFSCLWHTSGARSMHVKATAQSKDNFEHLCWVGARGRRMKMEAAWWSFDLWPHKQGGTVKICCWTEVRHQVSESPIVLHGFLFLLICSSA